jgi:hypothetical protein
MAWSRNKCDQLSRWENEVIRENVILLFQALSIPIGVNFGRRGESK